MKFEGLVKFITTPTQVNDKLNKVTVVLEEMGDSQFKESLAIDFLKTDKQDRQELLANVGVGDIIRVSLNVRCNESKSEPGKFFNSISGWDVAIVAKAPEQSA